MNTDGNKMSRRNANIIRNKGRNGTKHKRDNRKTIKILKMQYRDVSHYNGKLELIDYFKPI